MWPSLKPSQRAAVVAAISPLSATTVQTSTYVDSTLFLHHMAVLNIGAISTGGTVNAQVVQALDSSGTSAKTVKSIVAMTQAGPNSNQQCEINISSTDLDFTNGFKFIALQVTPSGAAAVIAGELIGFDPHYNTADTEADASSTQVIY